jgi:glycosyltransferase involved in cell wall biosynthesis
MPSTPAANEPCQLTVVVLTFDEEVNIKRCLDSVADWNVDIFVLDSYSNDRTVEIARRYTTNIFQHKYEGHAQQWDYALKNLPFRTKWALAMDADFSITPELKRAIDRKLSGPVDVNGFYVRHRQVFRGRFIRHGTIYPRYWLRLFRLDSVMVDPHDLVDLHFYVKGASGQIEYDLIEDNAKERDLSFWISKQCKFAKKQALEEITRRKHSIPFPEKPTLFGTPDQRTLWLKKYWYRLPLYIRPFLFFGYRYFLRFGFLDGKQGFLYHLTQAFLYRLLVDVEIDNLLTATQEKKLEYKQAPLVKS